MTQVKKLMITTLNLKLMILLEYTNIKKIFAKDYTPNWSEEVFVNKKFKNHVPWTYLTIGWRRNY